MSMQCETFKPLRGHSPQLKGVVYTPKGGASTLQGCSSAVGRFNRLKAFLVGLFGVVLLSSCGTKELPPPPPVAGLLPQAEAQIVEKQMEEAAVVLQPESVVEQQLEAGLAPESDKITVRGFGLPIGLELAAARQRSYETRFGKWEEVERQMAVFGFEDRPPGWLVCLEEVQALRDQYNYWLQNIQERRIASYEDVAFLQRDMQFLESGCGEVFSLGQDALSGWLGRLADAFLDQGEPSEDAWPGLGIEGELAATARYLYVTMPEQQVTAEVRRLFGLSLLASGQLDAAAGVLSGGNTPWRLEGNELHHRQLEADLLLAAGKVEEARGRYQRLGDFFSTLHNVDRWVSEQRVVLKDIDPQSPSFSLFVAVMRAYLLFDGRQVPQALRDGVERLEQLDPAGALARRGRQVLDLVEDQTFAWMRRRMDEADAYVEDKEFERAMTVLEELLAGNGRSYASQEMVRSAMERVRMAEELEMETQRLLNEQELAIQWENSLNLLDLRKYDEAIAIFMALQESDYADKAAEKIVEASSLAAKGVRRQASSIFMEARKAVDFERKQVLLLESWRMLNGIRSRYPQATIMDKVQQNINFLKKYIMEVDPTLLEVPLEEENSEEPEIDPVTSEVVEEVLQ